MQERKINKQKGPSFSIFIGDTFVGFVNIGAKNMPQSTLDSLTDPVSVKAVLAKADLRLVVEKGPTDMSAVDSIIGEATAATA